jgi:hypothetical protein
VSDSESRRCRRTQAGSANRDLAAERPEPARRGGLPGASECDCDSDGSGRGPAGMIVGKNHGLKFENAAGPGGTDLTILTVLILSDGRC